MSRSRARLERSATSGMRTSAGSMPAYGGHVAVVYFQGSYRDVCQKGWSCGIVIPDRCAAVRTFDGSRRAISNAGQKPRIGPSEASRWRSPREEQTACRMQGSRHAKENQGARTARVHEELCRRYQAEFARDDSRTVDAPANAAGAKCVTRAKVV